MPDTQILHNQSMIGMLASEEEEEEEKGEEARGKKGRLD